MQSILQKAKRMKHNYRRVLIFDVETNGLIPIKNEGLLMPSILQLSFIIYDNEMKTVLKTYDSYIRVGETIKISQKITDLTGITRETCDQLGRPIEECLSEFYNEYVKCDCIVGHNIEFDKRMIKVEIDRCYKQMEMDFTDIRKIFDKNYMKEKGIVNYCTMQHGKSVCNLIRVNKNEKKYIKSPKLEELYMHIFNDIPKKLHNSLIDTYVTMQCFIKMI
jgi:DNA polymerase III epsilon subunit-like protein